MKKITLLIITVLMTCSPVDDTKFYRFTNSDFNFVPTVYSEVGKIIMFRNQVNEEVQLEVSYYNLNKESDGGLSFSQGYLGELYYYESLSIGLRFLDAEIEGNPYSSCNMVRIEIGKSPLGILYYKINIPWSEDGFCGTSIFNFSSPFEDLQQLEINDTIFGNVKVFQTNRAANFYENANVDVIYFDLKQGLLGFDDTENDLQYKITND